MRYGTRSSSLWACLIILVTVLSVRFSYFTNESKNGYNATTWDALGYYMYLPGLIIYDDVTELKWFPEIDRKYNVSGGELYQATKLDKGGYAFKYLGGVAVMELPFFYVGHAIANMTDAPEDGFSWPYQYAVLFGAIFWFMTGCFILRKVLLRYYSETITALTLLLVCLASNILQYVSVDGAMSHVFIFPLYALMLWLTIRWHEKPKVPTALFIGLVAGLATISRPTELIIVFIPVLWGLESSGKLKSKWSLVKQNRLHVLWAALGGIIGILPQLLYWKHATGSWIYDVGSKWYFLNPWFRVLFGFEKGWFIYTPVAIFMIIGLFFLKGKPFRKAVITFSILNLWIIMAWSDWRYGASYSARALTQSYPVLALALAAFIERFYVERKRWLIVGLSAYFIFVNIFQIGQYNATVLHYDHMNARYYSAIYLNWNPSPLDYSLLDTDETIDEAEFEVSSIKNFRHSAVKAHNGTDFTLATIASGKVKWLKAELNITSVSGKNTASMNVIAFRKGKVVKKKSFRFAVPKSKEHVETTYACYFMLPEEKADSVTIEIGTFDQYEGKNAKLAITSLK